MARQSIPPEQWAQSRAIWESDTKVSYQDIATSLGISKQAVSKRANADKWQRRMDIDRVVNRAYQEADRSVAAAELQVATFAQDAGKSTPLVDPAPPKKEALAEHMEAEEIDTSNMTLEQRAEAIAVRKRAEILTRHRTEANALRTNLYQSIKTKDFNLGKNAKINAEAMQIIHNIERKAWGLDTSEEAPRVVIIERG